MRSPKSESLGLVVVGVTVGLALPPLFRCLKRLLSEDESTKGTNKTDPSNATTEVGTGTGTNAVRSGLGGSGTGSTAIRLAEPILRDFLSEILVKAGGASRSHAELVGTVLTYADSRGIPSHGANRADTYVNEMRAGLVDGKAVPAVERQSGCCAVVDGRNGLGAVTSELAMKTALSLAKKHGVGFVVCRNSNHFGAAGYWAKMALDGGMIGMSFTNTSPYAVPTGGKTRAVGTNPFCFFAPAAAAGEDSFQLDMATTVVPIGKIEVMDRLDKAVPIGWGVDRDGNSSADAEEICRRGGLCPLGGAEETAGYKGYGLGMVVEILCALLSGTTAAGPDVQPWLATRAGAIDYGHCFVVVDPDRFAPDFAARLGQFLRTMRSLPGNVRVAGDPEKAFEEDAEANGVLLHGPVAATLKGLAERHGVEIPLVLKDLDSSKSKESLYAR